MKNSTTKKATNNNISPTSKKKSISKKTKVKLPKNVINSTKNESVQLVEHVKQPVDSKQTNEKSNEKHNNVDKTTNKRKKNETLSSKSNNKKVIKKDDKSNDKAVISNTSKSKNVNKSSSSNSKTPQINSSTSSKKKQSKDVGSKSMSKNTSQKNSKHNSQASKNHQQKREDKKLAALLQLQEMRPRGPRLASLNASCKMQLLYESEREKINDIAMNLDTETDSSTQDLDDANDDGHSVDEIIEDNNNQLINDDLLTEDEQEDDIDEKVNYDNDKISDSEEENDPIREIIKEVSRDTSSLELKEITKEVNSKKEETKNKSNSFKEKERDLLSESINSVINSINDSLKKKEKIKEQQKSSSSAKKKNKKKEIEKVESDHNELSDNESDSDKLVNTPSPIKSNKQSSKLPKDNQEKITSNNKKSSSKTKETSSIKKDKKDAKDKKKPPTKSKELKNEFKDEIKNESKNESSKSNSSNKTSKDKNKIKGKKKHLVKESSMNERKRKLVDDSIELIDTRSTKRLASLNASAIMAASYQDEKLLLPISVVAAANNSIKQSPTPSPKPNYQEKHVEVIHKTTTVTNDEEVTETIKVYKKVQHVSDKIRDRLLAIEMMENETTDNTDDEQSESHSMVAEHVESDDEHINKNCIIEEPETEEDEQDDHNNKGKSVLQKKISASNASSSKQQKSSEVIEEVNSNYKPSSAYKSSSGRTSDGTQVTSMTKATKVKINKKKNNEKTTVEKYKYEVHSGSNDAFNQLNCSTSQPNDNLRAITHASSLSPTTHSTNAVDQQTANLTSNLNSQASTAQAATQFIPLQANPYASGYCIYPNATAFQLAYHQQLQQQQQLAYQQLQNNLAQQAHLYQQQPHTANLSQFYQTTTAAKTSPVTSSSSNNKQSYKSAFNAVPNSASTSNSATSSSVTKSEKSNNKTSSSDARSTPKVNGVQSVNESSSYLIHKPLAFNAATGNPIYNSTSNVQLKPQQSAIIHSTPTSNLHLASQASSLIPAMQCFPSNALAATASPYIFQYPTHPKAPDLATQLSTFHQSQTQLPNSSTLISPASQYSSAFQPNPLVDQMNAIAFIPGQTPFLSATQQLAAQTPMAFIGNPLSSLTNNFSAVQNFGQSVDPSSTIHFGVLGSAVNIKVKDSPDLIVVSNNGLGAANLVNLSTAHTLINNTTTDLSNLNNLNNLTYNLVNNVDTSTSINTTTATKKAKETKKSSKEISSAINKKLEKTKNLLTAKPISLTLNHEPVNLNQLTNNTNTTTSTQTKSTIIKIKPTSSLQTTDQSKTLKAKQNGNSVSDLSNTKLATGIRKEKDKTNNLLNRKIVNNQTTNTNINNEQPTKVVVTNTPEPINNNQMNLVNLTSSGLVLLNTSNKPSSIQQNQPVTKTLTIVLDKNDAIPPSNITNSNSKPSITVKRSNDQPVVTSTKKTKVVEQKSPPLVNNNILQAQSPAKQPIRSSSISITPISMTTTNSTVAKDASSLTTIQLDTASMRKKSSTNTNNNMFNNRQANQTGKCLTIHPSNFYSNGAIGLTTKKLASTDLRINLVNCSNNSSPTAKANDVNTNELCSNAIDSSMMKGLKKASKTNQIKNEKKPDHTFQIAHGWRFVGSPVKKMVMISDPNNSQLRDTYTTIRHEQGEVINVRDCALLLSGPKENDVPFVCYITALYEDPTTKAMMMNLLWYYRPEHTDLAISKSNNWPKEEIFASKHKDLNSVACIDSICYCLTFNEWNRYKKDQKMLSSNCESLTDRIVPKSKEPYYRLNKLPPKHLNEHPQTNDMVFLCRKQYDFRNKRILKNPS